MSMQFEAHETHGGDKEMRGKMLENLVGLSKRVKDLDSLVVLETAGGEQFCEDCNEYHTGNHISTSVITTDPYFTVVNAIATLLHSLTEIEVLSEEDREELTADILMATYRNAKRAGAVSDDAENLFKKVMLSDKMVDKLVSAVAEAVLEDDPELAEKFRKSIENDD